MVSGLLEGKNVNLRIVEKEDLPLIAEWFSNPEFMGEYNVLRQWSGVDAEWFIGKNQFEMKLFIIEKKDGTKIGYINHFHVLHPDRWFHEIGYALIPNERNKGYCSEATKLMVDYLFLSEDIDRIQAQTDIRNAGSQKVLERTGFKKEGRIRKAFFTTGCYRDYYLYSILREEWKEPKILKRITE